MRRWMRAGRSRLATSQADVVVNIEIIMHDAVPHPHDLRPGNLRMLLPKFVGDKPCRFAYRLDEMNHSQPQDFVRVVLCPRPSGEELFDLAGAVDHVADVAEVILRHRQAPPC